MYGNFLKERGFMANDLIIGAQAIAEYLHISTRTLNRWYVGGKFGKSMKRIGRKYVLNTNLFYNQI